MRDAGPPLPGTARRLMADVSGVQRTGRLPSLVAGLVRDGALVWSAGRGDVNGAPPGTDVQYRLGSITKTVTSVGVLRLRDEGLLRLGDPLDHHVPGTPFGDRTIGQLLAHDAGLRAESPGEWWERTPGVSWPQLAERFTAGDAFFDAGRRFHYSNTGFAVLGEVVARLRGRPWGDVVRDEVLLPLGMSRTTTRPQRPAAPGYAVHPWADVLLTEPEHDAGAMAPAGQLWATLDDLARFAAFLLGDTGEVLGRASLEEMRQPATVEGDAPGWAAYGLGLQVLRVEKATYVGHGGSMPGFLAGVLVDAEQQTGAVVLANGTSGLDGLLPQRMLALVRELEPHVGEPWSPSPVDETLLALTGVWYWGPSAFSLSVRPGGHLELRPLGASRRWARFRPSGNTWTGLDGYHAGETLRPVRADDGTLVALDIGTFVYTRSPYDPAAPVPGGVDRGGWL